jgi:hypothetical protein
VLSAGAFQSLDRRTERSAGVNPAMIRHFGPGGETYLIVACRTRSPPAVSKPANSSGKNTGKVGWESRSFARIDPLVFDRLVMFDPCRARRLIRRSPATPGNSVCRAASCRQWCCQTERLIVQTLSRPRCGSSIRQMGNWSDPPAAAIILAIAHGTDGDQKDRTINHLVSAWGPNRTTVGITLFAAACPRGW